jgi:hypothetical protein
MASASERSVNARIAANIRWSRETNRTGVTANARNNSPASIEYWMKKVDPDSALPRPERLKLAENAKTAYYLKRTRDMRAAKARRREQGAA